MDTENRVLQKDSGHREQRMADSGHREQRMAERQWTQRTEGYRKTVDIENRGWQTDSRHREQSMADRQ